MGLRSIYYMCTYFVRRGYVQFPGYVDNNLLHARRLCANQRDISRRSNYSTDLPVKCWNCDFPRKSDLFCSKCRTLQKFPEKLNYFDIIGVKEDYNIDIAEVQKKYRQLQNLLHPDRFSNSSEKEKELSESLSSLVNKAYSTLLHPLERGLYMLQLNNLDIPEGTTNLDPEFLLEVMEKNEQIEAAADSNDKVLKLLQENREVLQDYSRDISEAFSQKDVDKAKSILIKMKYYASIEEKLKKLKQDLGIVE